MKHIIEIAATDYPSAECAVKGGADRIELCSALSEGGLTPSYGLIKKSLEDLQAPIFPIIRPRGGDFLYTEEEFEIIQEEVRFCKESGCQGIVTGFLLPDGNINKERIHKIIEMAYPMQVTFHRAFDRCRHPLKALEDIIDAGCHRILTSGQKLRAIDGTALIKQLIKVANGRIVIMPGSGVRKENIKELAEKTGATEFHSSLKSLSISSMNYIHPAFGDLEEEYLITSVEPFEVQALRKALLGAIH